jgi:hypothetical protein
VNIARQDKKPAAMADGSSKKKWSNMRNKRHGNKPTVQSATFQGGKDDLDDNYSDCTGYGQSDRFMKTVHKIVDI